MKLIKFIRARIVPLLALTMLVGSILSIGPAVTASAQTACTSAASDSDGDGWGWENNASCRVVAGTNPTTSTSSGAACVDTDGDGWGWDGSASCRVTAAAPSSPAPSTPVTNTPNETALCRSLSTVGSNGWGFENGASCRALQPVINLRISQSNHYLGSFWSVSFSDQDNSNVIGWKITRNGTELRTIHRVPGQTDYSFLDPVSLGHYYGVEPIVAGGGLDYSPTMTIVSPIDGPEQVAEPSDLRVRQILNSDDSSPSTGDEEWRDNPDGSAADQAVDAFDEAAEDLAAAEAEHAAAEQAYEEAWDGLGISPGITVDGDGLSVTLGMQIPAGEIFGAYRDLGDARENLGDARVDHINAAGQISSCRSGSSSCQYSDPVASTSPHVTPPGGGGFDDQNPDPDPNPGHRVDNPGVCCSNDGQI